MAQGEESDVEQARYYSAIESLEYVESLFNKGDLNLIEIYQELQKCCDKIEMLISEEILCNPHLLKHLLLKLLRIMQRKSSKAISKLQGKEQTPSQAQSFANNTIETPRVSSLKEIAGLWEVKKILKSLVILPRNQPQLFVNHKACNSVLLFGPPGTGKTYLAHALASEAKAVLHCVSVGDMLSPLVGQTEKNVKAVFEHVRNSDKFSILFMDEVDGLFRTRHDSEQEHSRRMKTELMCQMSKMEDVKNAFLICATNCPWDLDSAFLRRFHKRIYIPLPDIAERHELFQLFTKNTPLQTAIEYWDLFIQRTEGFSGSDLSNLVQSALNVPLMELEETKIWKFTQDGFYEPILSAEDFDVENIMCCELSDLPYGSVRARPLHMLDLWNSLDGVSPTVSVANLKKYEEFIGK